MAESLIWTDIDYEKEGKQVGWLALPHSVTRSAYGTLRIPAACIKNGSGPTILLMAGNHGDEYEGQIALSRFIREVEPGCHRGPHHRPARRQPACRDGRDARLADRRRQPQPRLLERSRARPDLGHRALYRHRPLPDGARLSTTTIRAAARCTICPSPRPGSRAMPSSTAPRWQRSGPSRRRWPRCGPSPRTSASRPPPRTGAR